MPRQGWLADVARDAGLAVVEVDGWRERGNPSFSPGGVVEHHTAGARNGDIPSLRVLIEGRSDLPGPLCNYGIARSGTIYVIAAGRANHAGSGGWQGMVGNSSVIGVEYENSGTSQDPWPEAQLAAGSRLSAAVMVRMGRDVKFIAEHKEWAPSRKVDRHTIVGNQWRTRVRQIINREDGMTQQQMEELKTHITGAVNYAMAVEADRVKRILAELADLRKAVATLQHSGAAEAEAIVVEMGRRLSG